MIRYVGWPLLLAHFFVAPFWREQILALQTLICAATGMQSYHAATLVLLFVNLAELGENDTIVQIALHHVVVALAVLMEYYQKDRVVPWLCAAWSVRWLGSIHLYQSPERSCLRCVVFGVVANWQRKWSKGEEGPYRKVIWILLVHETMWCVLPVQMLYEIYFHLQDVDKKVSELVV
jgi:hypothetical protein